LGSRADPEQLAYLDRMFFVAHLISVHTSASFRLFDRLSLKLPRRRPGKGVAR